MITDVPSFFFFGFKAFYILGGVWTVRVHVWIQKFGVSGIFFFYAQRLHQKYCEKYYYNKKNE